MINAIRFNTGRGRVEIEFRHQNVVIITTFDESGMVAGQREMSTESLWGIMQDGCNNAPMYGEMK